MSTMQDLPGNAKPGEMAAKLLQAQLTKLFNKPDPMPGTLSETPPETGTVAASAPSAASAPNSTKATASPTAEQVGAQPKIDPQVELLVKQNAELTKRLDALTKALTKATNPEIKQEPRPTIKGVEGQVEALQDKIQRLEQLLNDNSELSAIEKVLPTIPETASLKGVPNLAQLVLQDMRAARKAAVERGEGELDISVMDIVKNIKSTLVESLKNHVTNAEIARELGLTVPQMQASTKTPITRQALTPELAAVPSAPKQIKRTEISSLLADQEKRLVALFRQ